MTHRELCKAVAARTDLPADAVDRVLNEAVHEITDQLRAGEEVTVQDLGKLSAPERAARGGRNPQTGEAISIAASKSPKLKAAAGLKRAVNE